MIKRRNPNLPAWLVKPINEICPEKLSDEQLYQKCREYGMNAKHWSRRFAGLLPEVARRGLHRRKGFLSIQQFAGQLAGMSEFMVDRILHLAKNLANKPVLKKLFESGIEGWSKIEKVAAIATASTDKFWADKVILLSTRALEVLAQNYRSKLLHVEQRGNTPLFCQGASNEVGKEGIVVDKNTGEIINYPFEPPVRFSFPASKKVEFDLRLAKQKLEKQSKQVLTWNETFQMLIQKSELTEDVCGKMADKNVIKSKDIDTSGRCNKCYKVGKIKNVEICDDCMKTA